MTQEEFGLRLSGDCAVTPGSRVLAAVSGGADSVALLCFFAQIRAQYPLDLVCAHVEHGIRAEESRGDMVFVQELCQRLGVPCYTACVDAPAYAARHDCGLEDAARVLRYEFLHRTAEETGADVIALAHHAGDQAETVLLHAARGCDIQGLCAMRMRSGRLIRPLLGCTAAQLKEYLVRIGQPWREDATNADMRYGRNRVRGEVLPALEQVSPGAGRALCRLSKAAQRDEDYFSQLLDGMDFREMRLADGVAVPRDVLLGMHPALLSRALTRLVKKAGIRPQSAGVIEAIMEALEDAPDGECAVINLTDGGHASVSRRFLCLTDGRQIRTEAMLNVPGVTDTPYGRFEVREAEPGETGDGKTSQVMPASLLRGACVTGRREGDVLIPFGRHTPVKLKKLMIEAGIERAMRNSVPVLRRDDMLLFAVGVRPGECCRSTKEDQSIMMVRYLGFAPKSEAKGSNQEEDNHDGEQNDVCRS